MKTFIVTISEQIGKDIKVEAKDEEEARGKVLFYEDDQVIKENFIDTLIVEVKEEPKPKLNDLLKSNLSLEQIDEVIDYELWGDLSK